jgi:hypothetical protein
VADVSTPADPLRPGEAKKKRKKKKKGRRRSAWGRTPSARRWRGAQLAIEASLAAFAADVTEFDRRWDQYARKHRDGGLRAVHRVFGQASRIAARRLRSVPKVYRLGASGRAVEARDWSLDESGQDFRPALKQSLRALDRERERPDPHPSSGPGLALAARVVRATTKTLRVITISGWSLFHDLNVDLDRAERRRRGGARASLPARTVAETARSLGVAARWPGAAAGALRAPRFGTILRILLPPLWLRRR